MWAAESGNRAVEGRARWSVDVDRQSLFVARRSDMEEVD
jgi:hypothetical protein